MSFEKFSADRLRRERELQETRLAQEREKSITRNFLPSQLPTAEQPADRINLVGHARSVQCVVALQEDARVVTASLDGRVRALSLTGGGTADYDIAAHNGGAWCLAALGRDAFASGGGAGEQVCTWRASTGERLEGFDPVDGGRGRVASLAAVGRDRLAVGMGGGALVFLRHANGRALAEVACVEDAHSDVIQEVAVHGGALVTASYDKTAAVWSATSHNRLAVLRGSTGWLVSAAAGARYIATGSDDRCVRVYENGGDFHPVAVLRGLHTKPVFSLSFVSTDMLMSTSADGTICFKRMETDAPPVARVNVAFEVRSAAVTPDARIACCGSGENALLCYPPAAVASDIEDFAAASFPSGSIGLDAALVRQEPRSTKIRTSWRRRAA